jgi:hypothetical protein
MSDQNVTITISSEDLKAAHKRASEKINPMLRLANGIDGFVQSVNNKSGASLRFKKHWLTGSLYVANCCEESVVVKDNSPSETTPYRVMGEETLYTSSIKKVIDALKPSILELLSEDEMQKMASCVNLELPSRVPIYDDRKIK